MNEKNAMGLFHRGNRMLLVASIIAYLLPTLLLVVSSDDAIAFFLGGAIGFFYFISFIIFVFFALSVGMERRKLPTITEAQRVLTNPIVLIGLYGLVAWGILYLALLLRS